MNRLERQAKANIRFWERSTMDGLHKAYKTHSHEKDLAWQYCYRLMLEHDGTGLKIISKNSFIFTAGFTFVDPNTGVLRFMFITPSSDTAVDM